jgi:hypothetical protein
LRRSFSSGRRSVAERREDLLLDLVDDLVPTAASFLAVHRDAVR